MTDPNFIRGADEQIEASSNLPRRRGKSKKTKVLLEAAYKIAEAAQPITGRGVGYKLFTQGLIPSMATSEMNRVYRLLKEAREEGVIPWDWIVDETRELEQTAADPKKFRRDLINSYRRDYWKQQPVRVEVWSEKGTVRGVLRPVLDKYGVGFRVMHGFSSATSVYDVAQSDNGKLLIALYVGDWDPSGLCMSNVDLPNRLTKYGGAHVDLRRIALVQDQLGGLPSFPASDKAKDPRYKWFTQNHGHECWELDALDPNILRDLVEQKIEDLIEPEAWGRCKIVERAESESLRGIMNSWLAVRGDGFIVIDGNDEDE
jgi:hypothetical protein